MRQFLFGLRHQSKRLDVSIFGRSRKLGKNYIYGTSQKDCMMFHYFVRSKSTGCLKTIFVRYRMPVRGTGFVNRSRASVKGPDVFPVRV